MLLRRHSFAVGPDEACNNATVADAQRPASIDLYLYLYFYFFFYFYF